MQLAQMQTDHCGCQMKGVIFNCLKSVSAFTEIPPLITHTCPCQAGKSTTKVAQCS